MRAPFSITLALALTLLIASCDKSQKAPETPSTSPAQDPAGEINYGVVKTLPHDTTAFTEGLLFHNGTLYESTGSPADLPQTRSVIGVVDQETGRLQVKTELDKQKYFGEGIVILNDKIYQLTYVSKVGFVYDLASFKKVGEFSFPSDEGWGMTTDGTHLIMSDGTEQLTYLDPTTFKVVKTVEVSDQYGPVDDLNELEYIKGFLYANVYTTNNILKIDPATGSVVGQLNLTSLAQDAQRRYAGSLELNGIAFEEASGNVYVTGKMWPTLYILRFKL
ncbi:glutaminyl-peptide cyclotransferase [Rufibacter ruber]|uniref:glutaminyl-peptide cyclotransferase n=1 Tax=Rufibacter ruber TaxID=1783499 RepID=UPI0009EE2439|nr:glutaminyl-peptide cyclotransferase [Rufibacter ruber]